MCIDKGVEKNVKIKGTKKKKKSSGATRKVGQNNNIMFPFPLVTRLLPTRLINQQSSMLFNAVCGYTIFLFAVLSHSNKKKTS